MSEVDMSKVVGFQDEDQPIAWNQRDLLIYAVGIGAKKDDVALVNELDKSWAPFPTYPVVLGMKGDSQDVVNFRQASSSGRLGKVPGLPKMNPDRIVHGSQSIEVLKPLPQASGPGWKMKRRIVGVNENKSGIVVESESILVDPHGTPYARLYSATFNLGAKATGTNYVKRIAGPPASKPIPKDRKPDWVVRDQTSPDQAIIYRLSGDYNALHIDPSIGKASGFGGVILHGLATFGFAARGLVTAIGGGAPTALKFFSVRFTSPVKPGDVLETSVWEVGPGPEVEGSATTEVVFVTKDVTTGKVCLGSGMAYIKKAEKSKL